MIVLLGLGLLGTALTDALDPSLSEWYQLESNHEQVMFPLRDYILEVKTSRPDVYDTNPPYAELFKSDKETTMEANLHSQDWNNRVGRLVWNTIKYDKGFDVVIEECNVRYQAYRSFPAGGEKEQTWAWNFFQDRAELTCNDEVQYEQYFDEGEESPYKPGLPEKCRALGDVYIDRIVFKNMAGEYIRGRPKDVGNKLTEEPDPEVYPTCNCWTPDCGFCSKPECTVKYDFINSEDGITVRSQLRWKIMLFDEDGNSIGTFQWNLKSIFLTGCIRCRSSPALRKIKRGSEALWNFSLKDGVLRIKMEGEVLFERELKGKCTERYATATRFSFYDMTCENAFHLTDEMEPGEQVVPNCGGACPRE